MTDLSGLLQQVGGDGVHWTIEGSGELNVNLVHLDAGHAMGEHVNDAVDVVLVVLAGEGRLTIDGRGSALHPHVVAHLPRRSRRRIEATADRGLDYLSIHRRRGPLDVQPTRPATTTATNATDEGGDPACWAHLLTDDTSTDAPDHHD